MGNKITIKHFLNKRLKPKIKNNKEYYPPYCHITYERKGAQFLFDWSSHHWKEIKPYDNRFTENKFNKFIKKESKLVESINDTITRAVKFELDRHKNKFKFKGFGQRIAFYLACFYCDFQDEIDKDIKSIVRKEISKKQYKRSKERLSSHDPSKYLKLIAKKYIPDIKTKITDELNIKIATYYLLDSFLDEYELARGYETWLFFDGFEKFESYLISEKYLSDNDLNIINVQKLNIDKPEKYLIPLRKFIDSQLEKLETKHFGNF